MKRLMFRSLITQLLCISFFVPIFMPIPAYAKEGSGAKALSVVGYVRAPRDPLDSQQATSGQQSLVPTFGSLNIPQDLSVGGTTTVDDLVVNGTITAPGGFQIGDLLVLTDGSGGQSCIVFRQPDLFEKGRICSSPTHNTPGIRMSVDGGITQNLQITSSGTVAVARDLQVDQTAYPRDLNVVDSATVGGLTTLQAANIFGHLNVTQTKFFTRGTPGVARHVLLVTTGDLTGPDTFNSIVDAVDSITDSSVNKPYAVVVGPGVFIENRTIILKEYVSLIGQSPESTIIRVADPNQDVIRGWHNASVSQLKVEGATGSGAHGIRFCSGGKFEIDSVDFGSNDTCLCVDAFMGRVDAFVNGCMIDYDAEFVTGIRVASTAVNAANMKLFDFTWLAGVNTIFDTAIEVSGPLATFVGSGIDVGSPTFFGGTGFSITNGAAINLQGSSFHGFDTALSVPAVGAGPSLSIAAVSGRGNTMDVDVEHTAATGTIDGIFARTKTHIDPAAVISLFLTDPEAQGTVTMGPVYMGDTLSTVTNMSPLFEGGLPLGVMSGGELSSGGGFIVNVAGGTGYLMHGDHLMYISWDPAFIDLNTPATDNTDNYFYVYYDGNALSTGTVATTTGEPNPYTTINLGKVRTGNGSIVFLQKQARESHRPVTNLDTLLRNGFGAIYEAGSLVTKSGDLGLNVSAGEYYFGTHEYFPSGATPLANWSAWYHAGPGVFTVANQTAIDYQHYDDGTGLVALAPDTFARHGFYVVGDGATERYQLVYGQEQYASLLAAQNGTVPVQPGSWNGNIALIASVIVKNTAVPGDQISEIRDERPRLAFKASGVSGVTEHDDLTGRNNNANHPQYLTIDGSRAMAANLPMGGNSITGVNQVNGVVVENHRARHGANSILDPLPTGVPVSIGTANAIGIANDFARSDHVHNHGNLPGGTLHADATVAVAGFMSGADKTKLDGINTADFVHITGDTMTGSLILAPAANLTVGGTTSLALGSGVIHADGTGLLTSSQVVDADIDPASSTYIGAAAANAATSVNTPNMIIKRDGAGNFSAGTITANLTGNATTAQTAVDFSGTLVGEVIGTQGATVVASVSGQSAAQVAAGTVLANNATNLNVANQIVKRDASGNFNAGTITGNLNGNATTATTAGSFSGVLLGDVTGTQGATTVAFVGGQSAASVASATSAANAATSINTPNTIVKRDGSGNFNAGTITATLNGNATSATSFSGVLLGDVTGTQGATVVSLVGGQSAAQVAAGAILANSATHLNVANQIVKRDASGNFLAGTINGVSVQSHASRHLPISGGDPLTTALPVNIGTSNALGSADAFARADHVHAHGVQSDGSLHAVATVGTNGFMSSVDKLKLDGLNGSSYVLKSGDTMTGALTLSGGTSNLTVEGSTTLDGTVAVNDGYTFALGVPGIPAQVLQVTKGTLHGPNQFNSVKAAVDSITDASASKPYIVVVGAGVFEESDTVVLKACVSLAGQSQDATVLRVTDPNKDVLHGANDAYITNLKIEGATATGSAGIRFSTGGRLELSQIKFGSNDTCMYVDATAGRADVIWESCIIESDAEFVTGVKVVSAAGNPANMKLSNFTWLADSNTIFDTAIDLSGAYATFVGCGIDVGSPLFFGGTGLRLSNGAAINLKGSSFHGFDTAILVPALGAGPSISLTSVAGRGNTTDINIANPAAMGTINGVFARSKLSINPAATISLFVTDPEEQGTVTVGPQYVGDDVSVITNISPEIEQGSNLGVIYGGDISAGLGLNADVASGTGYLMVGTSPNDYLKYVTWGNQSVALPTNADSFIYIDNAGNLQTALSESDFLTSIRVGKARTSSASIAFTQDMGREAAHTAVLLDNTLRKAFGPVYASGSIASKNGMVQLDVSSGLYYYGTHEYRPTGGAPISWQAFYRNGSGNYTITPQSSVDYQSYDDGSGVLQTIPLGEYAKHELFVVNDGASEQYLLVYGQETFPDLNAAVNGVLPNRPGTWTGNISPIWAIVVQNTATPADQISSIIDQRPLVGFRAGGVGSVTVHGDLTGLLDDDHPQYLLTSGGRVMTGNLQIGQGSAVQLYNTLGTFTSSIRAGALTASTLPLVLPITNGAANTVLTNDGAANLSWNSIAGTGAFVDGGNTGLTSPAVIGNLDANDLHIVTNGANRLTISSLGTIAIPAFSSAGVVHNNILGQLSSSLIVNNDITPGAIQNTALATVTALNTPNYIVVRDASGNFSAGTITANLLGNATTATSFTGPLVGDVTGTQGATVVSLVGGQTAVDVASATVAANAATSANTPNTIVKRDASGNFSAGTITANLLGNATTATSFTGLLAGDVTGTQGATVVSLVGGQTAVDVASATVAANAATSANTPNTIVKRDASGNFSAGTITANLLGNATTATSFTGPLAGDVTGTQGATVVSLVGGQTAVDVASATVAANAATSANTPNTIVKRDASGNFSAGTITANLLGNATTSTSFTGLLAGDVTGTQGATTVAFVGGQTAVDVASATVAANAATSANTPNTIVKRDALGNFVAGTITANLLGNATTATTATNFTGSLAGDVTGTQGATVVSLVGGQTAVDVASATVAANSATSANTPNTIVKRDASGNFSAGTITAQLIGNVTGAASQNVLKAGDTMTGPLLMSNQNQVRLGDTGVNYVAMRAPAVLPSSYTLTYPTTAGAAGQVLSTDGAGILSWVANGGMSGSAYYASVYVGTNLTLPANTTVTVPFSTEVLDSNNNFDPVTYTYTAPLTGIYVVGVNLTISNSSSYSRRLEIHRNGVALPGYAIAWSAANIPIALSGIVSLSAGNTVTIRYSGRSGDVITASDTSINIYKI